MRHLQTKGREILSEDIRLHVINKYEPRFSSRRHHDSRFSLFPICQVVSGKKVQMSIDVMSFEHSIKDFLSASRLSGSGVPEALNSSLYSDIPTSRTVHLPQPSRELPGD